MASAPDDAAALRVALYRSSTLKQMLWATLEGILADNDKLGTGLIDVRQKWALCLLGGHCSATPRLCRSV
jgi:hypothetical protein